MKRRIGILTSGGDCPGLNAAIRGVARAAYETFDAEIVGIHDGYRGLIEGDYSEMKREQFSGILTLGGTILGTNRTPFRDMRKIGDDNVDKVAAMKKTYKDLKLDCLVTLGGNGTHKTANLLSQEGLNVIGLPKTIDNDIYGTDFTFGFHTANDIATDVIDRIHTTAASHGRVMVIEIMGNKAGWLTLYSGVAGGADAILIPEIPYSIDKVAEVVERRAKSNKGFTIIAVAEGAMDRDEAKMKKKDREANRAATHFSSSAYGGMQDSWGKEEFAKVFRVFLDENNYPIDFHCIAGADRTGSVAYILCGLLGADEDRLASDWEITGFWAHGVDFCHEQRYDKLVNGFKKNFPADTVRERLEKYVLSLGFTEEDIAKFRRIMLE